MGDNAHDFFVLLRQTQQRNYSLVRSVSAEEGRRGKPDNLADSLRMLEFHGIYDRIIILEQSNYMCFDEWTTEENGVADMPEITRFYGIIIKMLNCKRCGTAKR